MGLEPKRPGRDGRINPSITPPCGFITTAVDLAMVSSTQGDSKLIADFASERSVLRVSQVMGIRRSSAANQTGLLGNRSQVEFVPNPAGLWDGQQALVDHFGSRPIFWPSCTLIKWSQRRRGWPGNFRDFSSGCSEACQSRLEGPLHL